MVFLSAPGYYFPKKTGIKDLGTGAGMYKYIHVEEITFKFSVKMHMAFLDEWKRA